MARMRRMNSIANSRLRAELIAVGALGILTPSHIGGGCGALRQARRFDIQTCEWMIHRSTPGRGGMFTGVKVFSATKAKEREDLGEQVTRWLRANADLEIVDRTVIQSSDNEFHCLTVVLFYKPRNGAKKA